jgi:HEAT repeat protein
VELLPYFNRALKDSDYGVRQAGVQAINDIGSPAVDKSFAALLNIIQHGEEDDVTWSSTEAIGKLENPKKAKEALPILLKVASTPPPEGTPDDALQVRYFALDSIKELAKKNSLNVVPSLEKLLNESKSPYKERVAKTILGLDPTNKTAQQVIDSVESK